MATEFLFAGIAVALFFAFWNGFTDAANAIATIVATRTLAPFKAVLLSAAGNFIGLLFGGAVAATIWKGLIDGNLVGPILVIAAILGGLIWDVITWYFGLPCSETHVLIGALVGAGLFVGGTAAVQFDSVVNKVILPMIYSPFLAFAFAFLFTAAIIRAFRRVPAGRINTAFRRLQIVSSFFFSFSHGSQDGQKVVGIIFGMLVFAALLNPADSVPFWVIVAVQIALSLGTLFGGWRIVRTMAVRLTKLRPYQGFSAETAGALLLVSTASVGIPVSTTHAINMAIMGTGATQRLSAVKWGVARRIVWAWILTLPASMVLAYLVMALFSALGIR